MFPALEKVPRRAPESGPQTAGQLAARSLRSLVLAQQRLGELRQGVSLHSARGLAELDLRQLRGAEIRLGQVRAGEVGFQEIRIPQRRLAQDGVRLFSGEIDPNYLREHRFRAADGSWIWFEGNPQLVFDADGRVVEVVNVFRDVTRRRAAEDTAHAHHPS